MEFIRTLKALADPLRLRILAAVSEEELTVGEVQEVVDSVQSAVSRNLAILREAGFVQDRKEGTSVYFSARQPMPEPAREVFQSLQAGLAGIPEVKRDQIRLAETKRRRLRRSRPPVRAGGSSVWDRRGQTRSALAARPRSGLRPRWAALERTPAQGNLCGV